MGALRVNNCDSVDCELFRLSFDAMSGFDGDRLNLNGFFGSLHTNLLLDGSSSDSDLFRLDIDALLTGLHWDVDSDIFRSYLQTS